MNQLFIALLSKAFHVFMTARTLALIAGKAMIFIVTMIVISWITRLIMRSRIKYILGGK